MLDISIIQCGSANQDRFAQFVELQTNSYFQCCHRITYWIFVFSNISTIDIWIEFLDLLSHHINVCIACFSPNCSWSFFECLLLTCFCPLYCDFRQLLVCSSHIHNYMVNTAMRQEPNQGFHFDYVPPKVTPSTLGTAKSSPRRTWTQLLLSFYAVLSAN